MPELILLAVVSLACMASLVILFLRLNQEQLTLIRFLTQTNQSLLNQVRAKDISTLAGLEVIGNEAKEESYISTEDREMQAYYDSVAHAQLGEVEFDEDDLVNLRSGL
jgi:hypothetical protein